MSKLFEKSQTKVVFIPPAGKISIRDFSIQRIAKVLDKNPLYYTIIIHIRNDNDIRFNDYFNEVLLVETKDELLAKIEELNYDYI